MIKRTVDDCGRVTIPPSIRKNLKISPYDTMDISQKGQMIIMQPCKSCCVMCGKVTDLIVVEDTAICCNCARKAAAHLWPKEKAASVTGITKAANENISIKF